MPALPSTRFPFVSLTKALERAEKIFQSDRGGKGLKLPGAFAAWDYSPKSSGGFQTVGALLGYGILEDEGAKDDRLLKLSPAARRYFLSEIEEDRAALRDQFARTPKLFAHLLEQWDEGSPPDPVARTYLKTEIKLNDQSAKSALSIYKDNLEVITRKGELKAPEPIPKDEMNGGGGGAQVTPLAVPMEPPIAVKVGDMVQATIGGMEQFPVPKVVTNVFRDSERGWFVSVRGENGSLPMEQITIERHGTPAPRHHAEHSERQRAPATSDNPMEIFMGANGRLQITADLDKAGVGKLKELLSKYEEIFDLLQ